MKVNLKDKVLPRNKAGDVDFRFLDTEKMTAAELNTEGNTPALLDVFTPKEVVELVNRALYQLEYQAESHLKRAAEEREQYKPVKDALKVLFPGTPFTKATDEQITKAMLYVRKMKEMESGK